MTGRKWCCIVGCRRDRVIDPGEWLWTYQVRERNRTRIETRTWAVPSSGMPPPPSSGDGDLPCPSVGSPQKTVILLRPGAGMLSRDPQSRAQGDVQGFHSMSSGACPLGLTLLGYEQLTWQWLSCLLLEC